MSQHSKKNDAEYHFVDREGQLWPAVICEKDMIPAEEVDVRPSGFYRAVLLLGILEFKWVLERDLFEFDPSASQRIPEGPYKQQLQEAWNSFFNKPNPDGELDWPDTNYWRSELIARDLQNIETSPSDDSDDTSMLPTPPRSKKVTPVSAKGMNRPWAKFKLDKQFGEEFGHARKKVKTDNKKCLNHWFPDEDDQASNDRPPPGYFEKIKREKEEAALKLEMITDDETDLEDFSQSIEFSAEEDEDKEAKGPTHRRQPQIKSDPDAPTSTTSGRYPFRPAASLKLANSQSPKDRTQHDEDYSRITQLCWELAVARVNLAWKQAESAAAHLIGLAPWSDAATLLVARVAFRFAPCQDVEGDSEDWLQEAVAEQIHVKYEHLRTTKNAFIAGLLRDHEDLAEMVYERRLRDLREKRVEVIEISDSEEEILENSCP